MRTPGLLSAAAIGLATLLGSSFASAGTTAPLSTIATLPAPTALKGAEPATSLPGLSLKSKDAYRGTVFHDLSAATGRGYCITQKTFGYRWSSTYGGSSTGSEEELDLDRLVEKDGTAMLERTRVVFRPMYGTVTATGRSQVKLTEVTRTASGIVVWAFREDKAIVILARRATGGVEGHQLAEEGQGSFVSADGCAFAGARVDARKPESGSFAQLTGSLPPEGTGKDRVTPTFIIDASVSRVTRDPEPMLSVRVRMKNG
jgi:hypothetical protein